MCTNWVEIVLLFKHIYMVHVFTYAFKYDTSQTNSYACNNVPDRKSLLTIISSVNVTCTFDAITNQCLITVCNRIASYMQYYYTTQEALWAAFGGWCVHYSISHQKHFIYTHRQLNYHSWQLDKLWLSQYLPESSARIF